MRVKAVKAFVVFSVIIGSAPYLATAQVRNIATPTPSAAMPAQLPSAAVVPGVHTFLVAIKGSKQGNFKGSFLKNGVPSIVGFKFSSQSTSPRDPVTGMATGKRQTSPITFTKEWDASSPQILQALASNEVLSTVTFQFMEVDKQGREIVYQTITLTNASIAAVRRYIDVASGSEPADPRALEDVSFTYQKIMIQDATGQTAFSDDWVAAIRGAGVEMHCDTISFAYSAFV